MVAVRQDMLERGPRIRPESREARDRRLRLRQRMASLGVSQAVVASHLGVHRVMLCMLLAGEHLTCRALGYDRWPERVNEFLDKYELAISKTQANARELAEMLKGDGLPLPPQLVACLARQPRGGRRARP